MTSAVARAVDSYWRIGVALLAIGIAWDTMTAALSQKADRSAIDSLTHEVTALRRDVGALRTDAERIICHLEPASIRCQRSRASAL